MRSYSGAGGSRAPRAEPLSFGGCSYYPQCDVLIEEELQGPEYTVDGFVQFGVVHAVVQHKETRRRRPFFGDGLIVSPPDPRCRSASSLGLRPDAHCGLDESVFVDVVRRGLNALGIDSWSFHAEMIVHNGVPNFVELNPRPAGGLLWQTAGLRLGVDPIEATVALHLRERLEPSRRGGVVGQFPIYADQLGRFSEVIGGDEALRMTRSARRQLGDASRRDSRNQPNLRELPCICFPPLRYPPASPGHLRSCAEACSGSLGCPPAVPTNNSIGTVKTTCDPAGDASSITHSRVKSRSGLDCQS